MACVATLAQGAPPQTATVPFYQEATGSTDPGPAFTVIMSLNIPSDKLFVLKRIFVDAETRGTISGYQEIQSADVSFFDPGTGSTLATIPVALTSVRVASTVSHFVGDVDVPWVFNPGEELFLRISTIGPASITGTLRVVGEEIDAR